MNLNIYLEKDLYGDLTSYSLKNDINKNNVIRKSIKALLDKNAATYTWSQKFIKFRGINGELEPFENHRALLVKEDLIKSILG